MDSILYLDNSLALMNVNMNYNMHANNLMAMISKPDQINCIPLLTMILEYLSKREYLSIEMPF